MIVHDRRPDRTGKQVRFVDETNRLPMNAFISTAGCRRTALAVFMDRVAEMCDTAGPERSDKREQQQGQGSRAAGSRRTGERFGKIQVLFRWLEVADECGAWHVRRHHKAAGGGGQCARTHEG